MGGREHYYQTRYWVQYKNKSETKRTEKEESTDTVFYHTRKIDFSYIPIGWLLNRFDWTLVLSDVGLTSNNIWISLKAGGTVRYHRT